MQFLLYALGHLTENTVVQIDLVGNEANVLLLDDTNLARYRRGDRYTFHGGHYTSSPVRIVVPTPGNWNIVVDLGDRAGHVNASVSVYPPTLIAQ